jgi:predicted amidohydrolase
MPDVLNLVVGQSPADLPDPQARLDWLEQSLRQMRDRHADLLVLPELFLTGYNVGKGVVTRAEPKDGPAARRIAKLAKDNDIAIHYGYSETCDGHLYNSAACTGADGRPLGGHRKLVLPPGFEGKHFVAGEACSLFRIGQFTIATLICYDAEFPENFRHVVNAGADLVVVPTALAQQWGVVSEKLIPTRAFENGVFVCYANHCGQENGLEYYGGSCIVSPVGEDIARAGGAEEFLHAKLDLRQVSAARKRLPYHVDRLRLPLPGATPTRRTCV